MKSFDIPDSVYYTAEAREIPIERLQRAVELDPQFVEAWARLADLESEQFHLRYDTTPERVERARVAIEAAVSIDPDHPSVRLAMSWYLYRCHRDYERALTELSQAAMAAPNNVEVLYLSAAIRRRLGDWAQAALDHERALELDPQNATAAWDVGVTYGLQGNFDRGRQWLARSSEIPTEQAAELAKIERFNAQVLGCSSGCRSRAIAVARATLSTSSPAPLVPVL